MQDDDIIRYMNTSKLIKQILWITLWMGVVLTVNAQTTVKELKTEYQVNPMAVETQTPRFSLKLISTLKNTTQNSYEIRVCDHADQLRSGKNIQWKTHVVSDNFYMPPRHCRELFVTKLAHRYKTINQIRLLLTQQLQYLVCVKAI